ncbi:hypothetical protein BS50DRAFT_158035 [Corynespora cassiicola Philippines]|uniref:Malate dehydrogenase n=1 Tax=Corynespora cassiicola Philippines TaxID=1448308 RepID=A0A2T2N7A0_CORCC|nr:hypothetical protein BS50DRAFT_158035 [Corynespora cassiicola Philippines]
MLSSAIFTTLALPLALAAPLSTFLRPPHHLSARQSNDTNDTTCDLSGIAQPENTLQPPSSNLSLMLIALGHGTQNYTCGANATAAPSSFGALATLYDASCAVATARPPLENLIQDSQAQIGEHFFADLTTPEFVIQGMEPTFAKKAEAVDAPDKAADVAWLRLEAVSQGAVKMVYRLNTKGGVAPGSCEGVVEGETVTVDYEALYWIYG